MTDQENAFAKALCDLHPGPRHARIALMGEFSSGKSTLANLMIGTDPLPMQVVATQLPPVWISYGSGPPVMVDLDGKESPCALDAVRTVDAAKIASIRFFCEEDILQHCDIIDMPGLSDPNMSADVWQRILPLADGVVWCSPATQAWRQSEAAVWESIDARIRANSILLLTRADMLLSDRDKSRVLRRVLSETDGQFSKVQLISLLQARGAGDDEDLWQHCGAATFVSDFLDMLDSLNRQIAPHAFKVQEADATAQTESPPQENRIAPRRPPSRAPDAISASKDHADKADYTPKFS